MLRSFRRILFQLGDVLQIWVAWTIVFNGVHNPTFPRSTLINSFSVSIEKPPLHIHLQWNLRNTPRNWRSFSNVTTLIAHKLLILLAWHLAMVCFWTTADYSDQYFSLPNRFSRRVIIAIVLELVRIVILFKTLLMNSKTNMTLPSTRRTSRSLLGFSKEILCKYWLTGIRHLITACVMWPLAHRAWKKEFAEIVVEKHAIADHFVDDVAWNSRESTAQIVQKRIQ